MIINQNILAILRTFSNLKKKHYEEFYTKETTSKAVTTVFISKIPNKKKISNEQFKLCEANISLDDIIKSINFQANNKSPGYGLAAEFHKYFSNELAPVFLDAYDSWRKFGTVSVTSRTGIISAKYKKGDEKDITNYRSIY